jgi:hypothetical protein
VPAKKDAKQAAGVEKMVRQDRPIQTSFLNIAERTQQWGCHAIEQPNDAILCH